MKKIDFFELKVLFAATVLLAIMACTNNKPAEAVENTETSVEATDTLSEETKQQNMEEVQAFLKECNAFFIATVDGDQPHVRPFGVSEIIDGRLYIITGKVKNV